VRAVLGGLIVLLALGIGALHFALDFVLFRGNILGGRSGGPPPGAPRLPAWPNILPLNQLFLLNLVLFVVLAIVFLLVFRRGGVPGGVVDLLLIAATVATLVGWNNIRRPNPQGLGTWAVSMELALIVFALIHMLTLRTRRA
jgi:hypothetical protein